jgi:hypothetical protein
LHGIRVSSRHFSSRYLRYGFCVTAADSDIAAAGLRGETGVLRIAAY